jgi:transmembrane sensor
MKKKPEHIDEGLLLKVLENSADPDSHTRNWNAIVNKVASGERVPAYIELPGTAQPSPLKLNTVLRMAAAITLLLGISFLLKVVVFDSEQLTITGSGRNPRDPVQLADGSLVYLNKNSEITFSKKFGRKNRALSLKGEAFFEVKRNEHIPFVVSTYKTTTRVLGTKFNIYSDGSGQVKVSVASGRVEFSAPEQHATVKLAAGENGLFSPSREGIQKESNTDPNFLAWKTGVLTFSNTPLSEAFLLMQQQYAHVFKLDSLRADLPTLTTTFDNVPLEAVLEELNLLLNTKNVTRNDTVYFKPNN